MNAFMNLSPALKNIFLFFGTFVSAFLFIFGLTTMFLMYAPAIAAPFQGTSEAYLPQLPLAEDRDEDFLGEAIAKNPGKQLFPALNSVEQVEASGNWITIPSIDVHIPLASSPSIEDADVIATLEHGAAMYPNGINPGHLGNVFIAAHSTGEPWRGTYRFAFLKINEIHDGSLIHLDYNGTRYTYRVVTSKIVKPTPDFTVASDRPVPTVTLMACWPIWTSSQRYLITADLTNVTQLTPTPS